MIGSGINRSSLGRICYLVAKFSLVIFTILFMILWIPLAVQETKDLRETEKSLEKQTPYPEVQQSLKFARTKKIALIIDVILREIVALILLTGTATDNYFLTFTATILLAIFWFIAHLDVGLYIYYAPKLDVATHIIHFLLLLIAYTYSYILQKESPYAIKRGSVGSMTTPLNITENGQGAGRLGQHRISVTTPNGGP